MTLSLFIASVLLAAAPVAGSSAGGVPVVTWKAPSAFVTGTPFVVDVEITAPEGGADVAGWLMTPAAFTVDGKDLAGAREGASIPLAAGSKVTGKVDLSKAIEAGKDFELAYAKELSKQEPLKVRFFEGVPAGTKFLDMPKEQLAQYQVVLVTTAGEMRLEMWPDVAPEHVRNFLDLVSSGFYDGTKFHRVMKGFMIQGGDPNSKNGDPNTWGQGNGPRKIKAEFSDKKHDRGVLSAARTQDPNSASCQFFICHAAAAHLDHQYSAFGKLVEGYEALDKIANAPGTPIPGGGGTRPVPYQETQKAIVIKAAPSAGEVKKQ